MTRGHGAGAPLPTPRWSLNGLDGDRYEVGVGLAVKVEADFAGALVGAAAAVMHRGYVAMEHGAFDPAIGNRAVAAVRRELLFDTVGFAADRVGELGFVAE